MANPLRAIWKFLEDLTRQREQLARQIIIDNPDISEDELNEAARRVLDRIVFIRMMEDRGIEKDVILRPIAEGADVYSNLVACFRKLDSVYGGLLFRQHFSEELTLEDGYLGTFLHGLYQPNSFHRFDLVKIELLGRIYEQFLGKRILIEEVGANCKVELKPEVRKAGGVYYTPQYIVDYIVENTVGPLIENKTPEEIENIRILDPSCGSGNFLVGAYTKLINYHEQWYAANGKASRYREDFQTTKDGDVKLSVKKKQEILTNNIYGVDIDREATEVAVTSLYMRLLEDTPSTSSQLQFRVRGHLLPNMEHNIRCGNSLIGTDFFTQNASDEEIRVAEDM